MIKFYLKNNNIFPKYYTIRLLNGTCDRFKSVYVVQADSLVKETADLDVTIRRTRSGRVINSSVIRKVFICVRNSTAMVCYTTIMHARGSSINV